MDNSGRVLEVSPPYIPSIPELLHSHQVAGLSSLSVFSGVCSVRKIVAMSIGICIYAACGGYFFLVIYLTPSIPLKSASCVHIMAPCAFAVANMMLSAKGRLYSKPSLAALNEIEVSRSTIMPSCICAAT